MSATVNIEPKMLSWAIDRAGYAVEEFVERFPKVQDWLHQKKQPTVKQLEKFSHQVYIPFGYLLLPEPPVELLPIPFFRTGRAQTEKVSLSVLETIRILKYRQDWLTDYLSEIEEEPLEFVGKFGLNHSPETIAEHIRTTLGLDRNWASLFPTWSDAKKFLTQKIEDAGIVVVFNSVVENNNHRKIDPAECRGFVLVDPFAPFLFINSADSKSAQMFTLAHELAHVWTGVSAGFDFKQMLPANDPMEKLCDQVAAELLVPAKEFTTFWNDNPGTEKAARHFKVSQIVAARRALDLGMWDKKTFFSFYQSYIQKEFKRKQSGGGDFYATQRLRLGRPFVSRLNQALKTGRVLYKDVYKLTGLKGDTYQLFVQKQL